MQTYSSPWRQHRFIQKYHSVLPANNNTCLGNPDEATKTHQAEYEHNCFASFQLEQHSNLDRHPLQSSR